MKNVETVSVAHLGGRVPIALGGLSDPIRPNISDGEFLCDIKSAYRPQFSG